MNCDCFFMSPFSPFSSKSWVFCVQFFMSLCHTLGPNALVCADVQACMCMHTHQFLAYSRGYIPIKHHTWQDQGFMWSGIVGAVPAMKTYPNLTKFYVPLLTMKYTIQNNMLCPRQHLRGSVEAVKLPSDTVHSFLQDMCITWCASLYFLLVCIS